MRIVAHRSHWKSCWSRVLALVSAVRVFCPVSDWSFRLPALPFSHLSNLAVTFAPSCDLLLDWTTTPGCREPDL